MREAPNPTALLPNTERENERGKRYTRGARDFISITKPLADVKRRFEGRQPFYHAGIYTSLDETENHPVTVSFPDGSTSPGIARAVTQKGDTIVEITPAQRLQLDRLDDAYARKHGVAVQFLKERVGAGEVYENSVAKALISGSGAWIELHDLPMEFSGVAEEGVPYRFVSDQEARVLLADLYAYAHAHANDPDVRDVRLFVLYTRVGVADRKGVYAFHAPADKTGTAPPETIGQFQPDALPLYYRFRLDAQTAPENVPANGVVACLTGIGERCLVLTLSYAGDDVRDLSHPAPDTALPQ